MCYWSTFIICLRSMWYVSAVVMADVVGNVWRVHCGHFDVPLVLIAKFKSCLALHLNFETLCENWHQLLATSVSINFRELVVSFNVLNFQFKQSIINRFFGLQIAPSFSSNQKWYNIKQMVETQLIELKKYHINQLLLIFMVVMVMQCMCKIIQSSLSLNKQKHMFFFTKISY